MQRVFFPLLTGVLFTTFLAAQTGQPLDCWGTYYYIPTVDAQATGVPLLDENERPLGPLLAPETWCAAAIEGTVAVRVGEFVRLFDYAGRSPNLQYDCRRCARFQNYAGYEKTGRVLWQPTEGFGLGVRNYRKVPFRTVAVDPELIPYGSVLYVPAARGHSYVDENGRDRTHDGYFFAADTGSFIKGNHLDFFLGFSQLPPFDFVRSRADHTFEVYLVEDAEIAWSLARLHGK